MPACVWGAHRGECLCRKSERRRQGLKEESRDEDSDADADDEEDDAEWYRREVGVDPEPGKPGLIWLSFFLVL